ncbi:MAG TPA: hypothetical protein VFQ85_04565 [Mycobacteriales bacterium]|nr:hypothetical protein [Mycobacteriales bacterium]
MHQFRRTKFLENLMLWLARAAAILVVITAATVIFRDDKVAAMVGAGGTVFSVGAAAFVRRERKQARALPASWSTVRDRPRSV